MSYEVREFRRIAGMFAARMPDLKLERMEDPRWRRGRRWGLGVVISTALVAISAGCESTAEVESLTSRMSRAMRRRLGLRRRLPDTTLREVLARLDPFEVRQALRHLIHAASRRGALKPEGLPFHVISMDGKSTAIPAWDDHYAQRQLYEDTHRAYGLVRTVTACLQSTAAKPVLDAFPIPAETNEMGVFPHAFESLLRGYGSLFQVVTYDAGVPSADNCQLVVDAGKDFCFRVKNEGWFAVREAKLRLGSLPLCEALASSEDVVAKEKGKVVQRSVFVIKAPERSWVWPSIKTLIRVHTQTLEGGNITQAEDKYYVSSLTRERLSGEQWLALTRGRWAVENNCHWTLDAIFREDEKPWLVASPKGAVVTMLLRRIAYSMLALFRAVSLRSEENRSMPWKQLMTWVADTLIAVTQEQLDGLRPREASTAAL